MLDNSLAFACSLSFHDADKAFIETFLRKNSCSGCSNKREASDEARENEGQQDGRFDEGVAFLVVP